jgi:multiple sugar transport system substrate-binding protein
MTVKRLARRYLNSRAVWFVLGVLALLLVSSVRGLVVAHPLERGELVILSGSDTSVGKQREQLVRRWNESHPETPARIVDVGGSADVQHSEMVGRAQSAHPAVDVYNLDVAWVAEFAAANYIRPIGQVDTQGFLARPLETCSIGDTLWALPFNTDAGLLYYRTDVLTDSAIPAKLPPSADDMSQIRGVRAGYAGQFDSYEGLTVNALEEIWAEHGDVVSGGTARTERVVIDSAATQRALSRLAGSQAGSVPGLLPDSRHYKEQASTDAFASGTVAMMRNWPVAYSQLKHRQQLGPGGFDIRDRFAVRELPGDSVLGGQDLAIAAGTTKPTAAKALIQFLTGEESERTLFRDGGLPATRTVAYEDRAVRAAQPYAGILLDVIQHHSRLRPITTHYPLFSTVFQSVINDALNDGGRLPSDAVPRLTAALKGQVQ